MAVKWYWKALVVLAVSGVAGTHLLTAQESTPFRVGGSRATPKQIRDSAEHPVLTATAPHTIGRTIQDLRVLADDLAKGGNPMEAARLKAIIKEIVARAELELADRKAEIARLTQETEELKSVIGP